MRTSASLLPPLCDTVGTLLFELLSLLQLWPSTTMNKEHNFSNNTIVVTVQGARLFHDTPLKISVHIESLPTQTTAPLLNPTLGGGLTIDISKGTVIVSKLEQDVAAAGAWMNGETMSQYHSGLSFSGLGSQDSLLPAATHKAQGKSTPTQSPR